MITHWYQYIDLLNLSWCLIRMCYCENAMLLYPYICYCIMCIVCYIMWIVYIILFTFKPQLTYAIHCIFPDKLEQTLLSPVVPELLMPRGNSSFQVNRIIMMAMIWPFSYNWSHISIGWHILTSVVCEYC